MIQLWNPNESGGFYWIDDAFGPNQLRTDFVDEWIAVMYKIKSAISIGNRFVLTSRTHIWSAAKPKLATRCLPSMIDGSAIVNVGALGLGERRQILYNHVKGGNQSPKWKSVVKKHLEKLSNGENFLPEIARRLGDKNYTKGIERYPEDLIRFVETPMDFLKGTIGELATPQQAALVLIFLSGSNLPSGLSESAHTKIVCDKYDVSVKTIGDALQQLSDSFVVKKSTSIGESWSFVHPTLTDALASLLGERADLTDLYLAGAKLNSILTDTVCDGQPEIPNAIFLADRSADLLVARLSEVEDELGLNTQLLSYLNERASEVVFRSFIQKNSDIFNRNPRPSWSIANDKSVKFCARAAKYNLLPDQVKNTISNKLQSALLQGLDASFLDDDDVLKLIPPTKLIAIIPTLMDYVQYDVPQHLDNLESDATSDQDGITVFDDIRTFINSLEVAFHSGEFAGVLSTTTALISEAETRVDSRYDPEEEAWEGEDIAPVKLSDQSKSRSIFSDVEE